MKIINLVAENVKKISAVEITPDGNLVQITGKNGQGKTSVLDAISWAIEGADQIQSKPIRVGADEAEITLDLGDYVVRRKFRRGADGQGSLLDDDGMKLLAEEAEKHDCQVWIERVDGSGKVGFVMEDGHLAGVTPATPAETKPAKLSRWKGERPQGGDLLAGAAGQ